MTAPATASLVEYRRRRDPSRTPEPFARGRGRGSGALRFVVQKHEASRLHFDLRLESDGVLKSWAVPKGPTLEAGKPRLAVQVEDHPIDYGRFEGTIPKGQYGGGTVQLWDRGTWLPAGDPAEGFASGALTFELRGERLRGRWRLVRRAAAGARAPRGTARSDWLLIKGRDQFALRRGDVDAVSAHLTSVATGRTMHEIAAGVPAPRAASRIARSNGRAHEGRTGSSRTNVASVRSGQGRGRSEALRLERIAGARRAAAPSFLAPQLATAATEPPDGDGWQHEIKLDGYRIVCVARRGRVSCFSRNRHDWTGRFSSIAAAVADVVADDTILDGEAVVFDPAGRTHFQDLQGRLRNGAGGAPAATTLVAFDLPWFAGFDLRAVALRDRRALLARILARADPSVLRGSEEVVAPGGAVMREACRLGLEGIVSKRTDAPYESGRSRTWIKVKCALEDEFVVCGATPPAGRREGFGALLLGRWVDGALTYCGRVGAGFSDDALSRIAAHVRAAPRTKAPCAGAPATRGVRWCEPRLVVQVAFAQTTRDGLLRQPVFKGVREDKTVDDLRTDQGDRTRRTAPQAPRKPATTSKRSSGARSGGAATVAGVAITHPDRPIYRQPAVRKLDVARYYEAAAARMLPYVAGRPLSLLRCPDGVGGECFVQKHFRDALPAGVRRVDGATDRLLVVDDVVGLVGLVQRGVVELHVWGSRARSIDVPDFIVLDLDPGPGVDWADVRGAARLVRDVLSSAGLHPVVRTSGGKGLHVLAPLPMRISWPDAKALSRALAEQVEAHEPRRFVTTAIKARRRGRIYIDYLRNGRGATAVANYSLRARPGAPVAVPLDWSELGRVRSSAHFHLPDMARRLRRSSDEWNEALASIGSR